MNHFGNSECYFFHGDYLSGQQQYRKFKSGVVAWMRGRSEEWWWRYSLGRWALFVVQRSIFRQAPGQFLAHKIIGLGFYATWDISTWSWESAASVEWWLFSKKKFKFSSARALRKYSFTIIDNKAVTKMEILRSTKFSRTHLAAWKNSSEVRVSFRRARLGAVRFIFIFFRFPFLLMSSD